VVTSAPGYRRRLAAGLGFSSAAVLIFEITLTRVFAITQFNHFVFVTVSLALLGFGASGSLLAAFPAIGGGGPRRWAALAAGQSLSVVGAYLLVNRFPFDSFSIAWDTTHVWVMAFNYLVLATPFVFGGLVIAVLLTGRDQSHPIPSNQVYAYSLVGSGGGCVVAIGGLAFFGGAGMVAAGGAVAMAAAWLFAGLPPVRRGVRPALAAASLILLLSVWSPPGFAGLRLSQYKSLSTVMDFPDAEIISTRWTAGSRVDHVRSESIRSLPGLSFTYAGSPPLQDGVTFDGDDLSPIPLVSTEQADFAPALLISLPYSLRPGGASAVLQPRGGLDVLVALASGSDSVTAVEPNRRAVDAAGETGFDVYADSRVTTAVEDPRVFIEKTGSRFDVIDLALTAPYRPVTSGAYSLAEDYLLTVDAFDAYLGRLRPDGILAVTRWLQVPPSEESRLVALAAEAVRNRGKDPADSVIALRGYANALVMIKPGGFDASEVAATRAFATQNRFDLIAAPGLVASEANLYNRLPVDDYFPLAQSLLLAEDPAPIYREAAFDISPPSDDRPFFSHFFKWSQADEVLDTLGKTWQPFGGAGYFVVLAVLGLATAAALVLILGPLAWARVRGRIGLAGPRMWTVGYFGLLGLAFLLVEIPIIQKYILLVGRPTTSLAVVLFGLLVSSGWGSMMAPRLPWRGTALLLTALAAAYPLLLNLVTAVALAWALPVRMIVGLAVLFPIGFLMGSMFPNGLRYLETAGPGLVPWAWAINGVFSVISSVTATLLALSSGFSTVVLGGALCYGLSGLLARPRLTATGGSAVRSAPGPG
jgi:hypothetical protein